jgi:hypothetical protein
MPGSERSFVPGGGAGAGKPEDRVSAGAVATDGGTVGNVADGSVEDPAGSGGEGAGFVGIAAGCTAGASDGGVVAVSGGVGSGAGCGVAPAQLSAPT